MASIFQDFSFANLKEHVKQLDQYAAFAEFLGSFLFMFFGGACVANRRDILFACSCSLLTHVFAALITALESPLLAMALLTPPLCSPSLPSVVAT
jgi:glycerol uptake facilitator-like aquaporin